MGDQNGDGCDDFMITKMDTTVAGSEGKAYFYYGGNPVPDTPAFYIRTYNPLTITACDINRDGYRDIISHIGGMHTYPVSYDVYLGGPTIDSIPDFVFFHPVSNSISILYGRDWPIDYDGDGWEEFVTYTNTGYFYFLKTTPEIQPVEYHFIKPDSAYSNYRFQYNNLSFTDIDGDGKTDFSPMLWKPNSPVDLRRSYFGNSDFLFTDYH